MAAITWTDVSTHASSLVDLDVLIQTDILAFVNEELNCAAFGGEDSAKTRLARIYLAAHLGTVSLLALTGSSGPVTSETEGSVSRSYGDGSSAFASIYGTTSWGQLYLSLLRSSTAALPFVL